MIVSFRLRKVLAHISVHFFLVLIALLFLLPLYWMIISAFRPLPEIYTLPVKWLPRNLTLENLREVILETSFLRSYFNSLVVVAAYVGLSLFLCSLAGYSLAKYDFPGRETIFLLCLSTIMLPPVLHIIPNFLIIRKFGWINTYYGLIFPGVANVVGLFLARQFMYSVPDELLDAARLDGCSEFSLFYKIALPVIKPGIVVTAIILFGAVWNAFLWQLIVATSERMYTLPVFIAALREKPPPGMAEIVPYNLLMAASLCVTLPLLTIFIALQKRFMQSVQLGALKG